MVLCFCKGLRDKAVGEHLLITGVETRERAIKSYYRYVESKALVRGKTYDPDGRRFQSHHEVRAVSTEPPQIDTFGACQVSNQARPNNPLQRMENRLEVQEKKMDSLSKVVEQMSLAIKKLEERNRLILEKLTGGDNWG